MSLKSQHRKDEPEAIAVVGMACRLPGRVFCPNDLWNVLSEKRSTYGPVPSSRFYAAAYQNSDPNANGHGAFAANGGYYLDDDPMDFDAGFFSARGIEAATLDPQQKLLLEVTYECLESSGTSLESISGSKTGCYVGTLNDDFRDQLDLEYPEPYTWTGFSATMLSNRLSYFYNLKGPSLTVDTACSSSIYALHLACNAIRNGDVDGALVGASNYIASPLRMIVMGASGALSPDGSCHSFDAKANGYGRAEGVGVVYVTSLQKAISENLPIRSVICGSAINANGRTTGITHPDIDGQISVIRQAYETAGLNTNDTTFVECHGTGTRYGDVIETKALAQAFQKKSGGLYIGTVKSNFGHSEPTSGIIGLIKCVLALEHEVIPPNHGFIDPNPDIRFAEWGLQVPTKCHIWPNKTVQQASLNSFGFGGSNAHIILQSKRTYFRAAERPEPNGFVECSLRRERLSNGSTYHSNPSPKLLIVSALSRSSLLKMTSLLNDITVQHSLSDLAYTLNEHRSLLPLRTYAIATQNREESLFPEITTKIAKVRETSPRIAYVFTGQGASWAGMGKSLIASSPVARACINALDKVLRSIDSRSFSLLNVLNGVETVDIHSPEVSQVTTTALQIAVTDLLKYWGLAPYVSIGHSSGEIAACYAAGLLSARDALLCAYYRGISVVETVRKGAMLAVALSRDECEKLLHVFDTELTLACHNSPTSCTVSGDQSAIAAFEQLMRSQGVQAKVLSTGSMAYHSSHMEKPMAQYSRLLESGLSNKLPTSDTCHFISTVLARVAKPEEIDAHYWAQNLRNIVRFSESIAHIQKLEHKVDIIVEIGPHSTLQSAIRQSLEVADRKDIAYVRTLHRGSDNSSDILNIAGQLFLEGAPVRLDRVNQAEEEFHSPQLIADLPHYQWDHSKKYAPTNRASNEARFKMFPRHELLGSEIAGLPHYPRIWRNILSSDNVPWLKDHVVDGQITVPFTGFLMMASVAGSQLAMGSSRTRDYTQEFSGLKMEDPLVLAPSTRRELLLSLNPTSTTISNQVFRETFEFRVTSPESSKSGTSTWVTHLSGYLRMQPTNPGSSGMTTKLSVNESLSDTKSEDWTAVQEESFYDNVEAAHVSYGPSFKGLSALKFSGSKNVASGMLSAPNCTSKSPYAIHPALLDQMLQLGFLAFHGSASKMATFLPVSAGRIVLSCSDNCNRASEHKAIVHATKSGLSNFSMNGCLTTMNNAVCIVEDLKATRLDLSASGSEPADTRHPFCSTVWMPDISVLRQDSSNSLLSPVALADSERLVVKALEDLAQLCIVDSVFCIRQFCGKYGVKSLERVPDMPPYLSRYQRWLERQAASATSLAGITRETIKQRIVALHDQVKSTPEGQLLWQVWASFDRLLDRTETPLDILMAGGAWNALYREGMICKISYRQARKFMRLLAHKRPHMKVLEVGAGTGGLTIELLQELGGDGPFRLYDSYTFSDISKGFFGAAQTLLKDHKGVLYRLLNIEEDPVKQGFAEASYDVIVCSNVLHATKTLKDTLHVLQRLVKPGGYLMAGEITKEQTLAVGYALGCLPGWWLATEEYRTDGPLMRDSQWIEEFTNAGFTMRFVLPDIQPPYTSTDVLCAQKPTVISPQSPSDFIVLHTSSSHQLAQEVARQNGCSIQHVFNIEDSPQELPSSHSNVIFFDRIGGTVLSTLDANTLQQLKRLVKNYGSRNFLWISTDSNSAVNNGEAPDVPLVVGLCRELREESSVNVVTLRFHADANLSNDRIACLSVMHLQDTVSGQCERDMDFEVKDGVVNTIRLYPDSVTNEIFDAKLSKKLCERRLSKSLTMRANFKHLGQLSSLYFHEDESAMDALPPEGVEVEVRAAGMNFRDVMTALGRVSSDCFSQEGAGIVRRVGSKVTRFKAGDRVAGLGSGNYGRLMISVEHKLVRLKETESFSNMASVTVAYTTALYCLKSLTQLRSGESVLIHAATGGLGLAAIQIAKMLGATVYATVGSPVKAEFLSTNHSIPPDRILNSRSPEFAKELLVKTGFRGVDVILTATEGDMLTATATCLAPLGRLVSLGVPDASQYGRINLDFVQQSKTFMHFILFDLSQFRPAVFQETLQQAFELLRQAKLTLNPIATFPLEDLGKAMTTMTQGSHIGKLVIDMDASNEESKVLVRLSKYESRMNPDGVYLLVGCLGGLGRSIALWMFERGARNFVFLSRSGAASGEASQVVDSLRNNGATVAVVKGDVAVKSDVVKIVNNIQKPIMGVIHAAMVLEDVWFSNISIATWERVLGPKVTGAKNLHYALRDHALDFFVITSSIAGLFGVLGQPAYCAANAYLDSFAHWRSQLGLPTMSLNVGVIEDSGYVHERPHLQRFLTSLGGYGVPTHEVMQMVDLAICRCLHEKEDLAKGLVSAQISGGFEPSRFQALEETGVLNTLLASESQPHSATIVQYIANIRDEKASGSDGRDSKNSKQSYTEFIEQVKVSPESAQETLTALLLAKFASALAVSEADISASKPIADYGADSLMAGEIRGWLLSELAVKVPVFDILGPGMTISRLAMIAIEKLVVLANAKATVNDDNGLA